MVRNVKSAAAAAPDPGCGLTCAGSPQVCSTERPPSGGAIACQTCPSAAPCAAQPCATRPARRECSAGGSTQKSSILVSGDSAATWLLSCTRPSATVMPEISAAHCTSERGVTISITASVRPGCPPPRVTGIAMAPRMPQWMAGSMRAYSERSYSRTSGLISGRPDAKARP